MSAVGDAAPAVPAVPEWIEVRQGTAPLVLFAPHGGRRAAPRRPGRDNVNDLHTADLTRELGAACDATWIVNEARDRNECDLNRVDQIRRDAPWLLDLLAATLEDVVARHGHAVLLAIHGWNVVQTVCDLGVGLVEEGDAPCRPAARGLATVSTRFLDTTVRRLQRLARRAGILVTLGVRYPAAHPSNVMQLLTPARAADPDPRLRRLAALADAVDAVQLELGIPLRWPGPRRLAFTHALVAALAPADAADAGATRAHRHTDGHPRHHDRVRAVTCGGRPTMRVAVQAADTALAVLTSVDVAARGAVAGRLLLSDRDDRLALFTGEVAERRSLALQVPSLRVLGQGPRAFEVRFDGALLSFPMLTPFADLERGLAAGRLVEARVRLRFAPAWAEMDGDDACFGTLEGVVRLDGVRHTVRAAAIARTSVARPLAHPSIRIALPETALGALEVHSTAPGDGADGVFRFALAGIARRGAEASPIRGVAEVSLAHAVLRIRLDSDAGDVDRFTTALARIIPVRRPGGPATVLETFYALCRRESAAPGWLELTLAHAEDTPPLIPQP